MTQALYSCLRSLLSVGLWMRSTHVCLPANAAHAEAADDVCLHGSAGCVPLRLFGETNHVAEVDSVCLEKASFLGGWGAAAFVQQRLVSDIC